MVAVAEDERVVGDAQARVAARANEVPLMIMSTVPSVMPWLMSVSLPSEGPGTPDVELAVAALLDLSAAQTDSVWYGSLVS